jgi:beta-xylosidase
MKVDSRRKKIPGLVILFFLLLVFPVTLYLVQMAHSFFSRAFGQKAQISIDASTSLGPISPIWQMLAQGGEEQDPFHDILGEIADLKPRYIRIDHIYDFYNVVKKESGQLVFNFSQLDKIVDEILITGALPFFSLSYMPPALAQDGQITNPPSNWDDWSVVVQKTIEHYSGRSNRNLSNVAYEVWNEPDLFGNWQIGGNKDYRELYRYAAIGAGRAENANFFKFGGPSTTAPYKNWVDDFLDYVTKNHLRLDFYSWHRYSLKASVFSEDINRVDTWLFGNGWGTVEKYITESGSDSQNNPIHDGNFDAAYLVAISRQLLQRVDGVFSFEIKDGPSPEGKKFWGRWGVLTNERGGPIEKKPKYFAFNLLNKMTGNRLSLEGEGTWVTGFSSQENESIKTILVNLDSENHHTETVPITIKNLENGNYFYRESSLTGTEKSSVESVTDNTLKKVVFLEPNNVIVLELTKAK